ncbi:TIGR02186 family protein [Desulfallas sp. Bu1-1]|uniref:TIGR02186 family protein n=1 Tax=Desulfallas sp. Bu1-1 TaxID=2787620 RepID=UPI00189F818E|nr:TIGR02186 family protein [Desulfallas sp. Bu1-1]MBF7082960.1 TIGR02186 family protein [Desulfallas sp. Bu1-1]
MKKSIILMLALVLVLTWISLAWAADTSVNVSPDRVDIGFNFQGTELSILGTVPDHARVYIKVASPNDSMLELNKKGRLGFFWMNVENVSVTAAPKLYQVITSDSLDQLPGELQKKLGLSRDFKQIYTSAKVYKHSESGPVELPKQDSDRYVSSLINIYQKSGLYAVKENAVQVTNSRFKANVKLPPNIPHEKCTVTVYAVKEGKLVGTASAPLQVNSVGMVKWLSREATYDGPTYGFIAVLIALACGIGIALLFSYLDNALGGGKKKGFNPGASH